MQVRDSVWALIVGKLRPAVVLETVGDRAYVAYGTREDHVWPRIVVAPATRAGRAFKAVVDDPDGHRELSAPTFFYGANKLWVSRREVHGRGAAVPFDLLIAIRKVIAAYDADAGSA